jgi:hypothetical protein
MNQHLKDKSIKFKHLLTNGPLKIWYQIQQVSLFGDAFQQSFHFNEILLEICSKVGLHAPLTTSSMSV